MRPFFNLVGNKFALYSESKKVSAQGCKPKSIIFKNFFLQIEQLFIITTTIYSKRFGPNRGLIVPYFLWR